MRYFATIQVEIDDEDKEDFGDPEKYLEKVLDKAFYGQFSIDDFEEEEGGA